jgi:hypothetical protein
MEWVLPMPIHNFMLEDLAGALKAVCLFPIFLFFPGYVAAWLLDLFDFRRRTFAFRVALSLPLSIGLGPILTFLLAHYATFRAVWVFYSAAFVLFFVLLAFDAAKRRLRHPLWPSGSHVFVAIVGLWMAVSIFSLIDIQFGDRLYYPTSVIDYSVRTAFVNSISTTGVPPANPFFHPGHFVLLRYHYFWLMMCSLVNQVGGAAVTPRLASIGGTFWAGVGLMALVLVYLRVFLPQKAGQFRNRALMGIVLLGITGLDILPSLFFLALYARGMMGMVLPSVEWWNEHVDWFVYSTIWAPHAMAAMIACFIGFLLIWHAPSAPRRNGLLRYAVPGGIALASSVGCSIYVTFAFAIFLTLWTLVTIWKRWFRETAGLVTAGLVMIGLASPYLRELTSSNGGDGGPLFHLTVRTFSLAALIPTRGLSETWRLILVNGSLLPLNYLLEFGFFFLIARYKWQQHRASGQPASRQDLAFTLMAATSILVCTFLRSSIACNDLGWRGLLAAEFVLLLWAVDIFPNREQLAFLAMRQRELLVVFFALGAAGTIYDLAVVRLYPVLSDRGVVPPISWMSPDRDLGKRTYAARMAYEWLQSNTSQTAEVQSNPRAFQDTMGMIYGNRPTVASDMKCLTDFGGDPKECSPIISRLQTIYPSAGSLAASDVREVCSALPLDILVAKDTDAAWSDRRSWVWNGHPLYANSHIRLFSCRAARIASAQVSSSLGLTVSLDSGR